MIWRCPNCQGVFEQVPGGWRCRAGHNFDLAKQGYINLLLPNQKASKDPGDNRTMVQGRRDFLQQGHYQPLVEAMAALLQPQFEHGSDSRFTLRSIPEPVSQAVSQPVSQPIFQQVSQRQSVDDLTLLDLGCGEGYYLKALTEMAINAGFCPHINGLDISREAIKRAAGLLPQGRFCVASSYRIPVVDASIDIALQIFAPVEPREIERILRPGGVWLRVAPGPRHLYQLKAALYDAVREHDEPSVPVGFKMLAEEHINFPVVLSDGPSIANLLTMTPFGWHGSSEGRQALLQRESLTTEADFLVQLLATGKQ